jgi:hypothetical protein
MQNRPEETTRIGCRFMRANFSGDSRQSLLAGTYDLAVTTPLGSQISAIVSLPFNRFAVEDGISENSVGNLYLGIQAGRVTAGRARDFSFGIYLPTASEDKPFAAGIGTIANLHELQRSLPNLLTLYGNFAFRCFKENGAFFGIEFGPQWSVVTVNGSPSDLYAHYGIRSGIQFAEVAVFAELVGIAIVTEDLNKFSDHFVHSLDFGIQLILSKVRPGVFYAIPLKDEMRDVLDGVLGIKLDLVLPRQ